MCPPVVKIELEWWWCGREQWKSGHKSYFRSHNVTRCVVIWRMCDFNQCIVYFNQCQMKTWLWLKFKMTCYYFWSNDVYFRSNSIGFNQSTWKCYLSKSNHLFLQCILQFHLLSLLSTKNAVRCGESTWIVYKKTINFAFIHRPHITTTKPNSTNHSTFDAGLNYVMLRYFGMCHRWKYFPVLLYSSLKDKSD
jgi:hypothetical protein